MSRYKFDGFDDDDDEWMKKRIGVKKKHGKVKSCGRTLLKYIQ